MEAASSVFAGMSPSTLALKTISSEITGLIPVKADKIAFPAVAVLDNKALLKKSFVQSRGLDLWALSGIK